ncbi:protein RD3-like isoform X1 [Alosa sapidissima]|uniref:protein RD3-like isoform X1 n=1 Tax=Alosa sapidissima TaxID=34773 RepID=UPI001C07F1A1|nr:protein RD3-like isoform X1 [Alosa sapidissima]
MEAHQRRGHQPSRSSSSPRAHRVSHILSRNEDQRGASQTAHSDALYKSTDLGNKVLSSPMHLFGWMRWPRLDAERASGSHSNSAAATAATGCLPNGVLLRELLWHLEQRECLLREEAWHLFLSRRGAQGCRRPPPAPAQGLPRPLMPSAERRQLERLCARVPPSHTAAVLSRFREVLATNEFLPWELVCVFKQVLRDFLVREEEGALRGLPPPRTRSRPPPAVLTPTSPARPVPTPSAHSTDYRLSGCPPRDTSSPLPPATDSVDGHRREEIPTISSYVDRHLSAVCPYAVHRDWSLPYCYSVPYDCPEAYGTTL